jgi:predicted DNA-binding transcriptional regulator YafY
VWVDALARFLWEQGLDVYTDPEGPPGHLVVRDGEYTRTFTPGEVAALAATLLAMSYMDEKGRPLRAVRGGVDEPLEALWEVV